MVSGRGGHDLPDLALTSRRRDQTTYKVASPPNLEGSGPLELLILEEDFTSGDLGERV
jgi:hypothetical protein